MIPVAVFVVCGLIGLAVFHFSTVALAKPPGAAPTPNPSAANNQNEQAAPPAAQGQNEPPLRDTLGYWKVTGSRLLAPTLYGLGGALMLAALIQVLRLPSLVRGQQQPAVTVDNIEDKVKEWAEYYNLPSVKGPDQNDVFFARIVTSRTGHPIFILRTKDRPNDLNAQVALILAAEHEAMRAKLTPQVFEDFLDELRLRMAQAHVSVQVPLPSLSPMVIKKGIPIRPDMAASDFAQLFDDVDSGWEIARNAVVLGLKQHSTH